MIRRALLLVPIVLAASPAHADSWRAFRDFRAVSPSGRTYVVIREEKGAAAFELCRRRKGAPLLEAGTTDVDRDPGDELLAKGTVPQLPLEARVVDSPPGVVLFERYASVGYGDSLVFVSGEGKIVFRRKLRDLYEDPSVFSRSVSSIWWYEGFWVDEARGSVVTVAEGDLLREVSLADGKVTTPGSEIVLGRIREALDACEAVEDR